MKILIFTFTLFFFPFSLICQPFGIKQTFTGPSVGSLHLQDITGDSIPELVTSYQIQGGSYQMVYYTGLQQDTFTQPPVFIANNCRPKQLKDIDQDGDLDIIAFDGRVTLEGNNVIMFLNDGVGNFTASDSLPIRAPLNIQLANIDSTGLDDIVITNSTGIYWFAQEQPGVFEEEGFRIMRFTNYYGGVYPVVAGDIDGDQDIDLIIADEDRGEYITWLENYDRGTFYDRGRISDYAPPRALELLDIDYDGDLDLIAISGSTIYWLKNNGKGGFSRKTIIGYCSSYYFADLDLDGDLDIVIGTDSDSGPAARKISWIENYGEGRFSKERILITDFPITGVITKDLNGDQFPEILATERYYYTLNYLENKLDDPSLQGTIYRDANENSTLDSTDTVIPYFQIGITDNSDTLYTYTNKNGQYRFYLPQGNYEFLFPKDSSCLTPFISDSTNLKVALVNGQTITRNFILQLVTGAPLSLSTSLTSAPTRCDSEVSFWLNVENTTCDSTPIDSKVALVSNNLARFVSAESVPFEISGDTIFWIVRQLPSFQQHQIKIKLKIAGSDYIGDTIRLQTIGYFSNENGQYEVSSNYNFSSTLRCSYDPNDKLVEPLRNLSQNHTLFDEAIIYTIRFQNTGNDTAFNVTIKDRLDDNLDWATFKPLDASHSFESFLYEGGLVEFRFRNIFLPDSTTSPIESNGYVRYLMKAKKQLAEYTIIQNTAKIFFDSNPHIQTNTVNSLMVSALPVISSTTKILTNTVDIKVFPNPFEQNFSVLFSEVVNGSLSIFDITGRKVHTKKIDNTNIASVNAINFPSGIYFYVFTPNNNLSVRASGKLIKQQ